MARSNGALLLARSGRTQETVAAESGCSRAAVGHWMSGTRRPNPAARKLLEERYSIPAGSWDEWPPKRRAAAAAAASPPPEGAPGRTPATPDSVLLRAAQLETRVDRLFAKLDEDVGALPLEEARVIAAIAHTLGLLGKLTGQFDLGSRIFRLPVWREIERAIERGLEGHKEAAAAVARELRRVEEETGYRRPV